MADSNQAPILLSGYLTELSLVDALLRIVGVDNWLGGQLRAPKCRRRWDMGFRSASGIVVVEYDGDGHYCNTLKIKGDAEKDRIAQDQGWRTVRIPYWLQLDSTTLAHYFGLDFPIQTSFPHGFITTKVFPASFCEMGVDRFEREMSALPEAIRSDVLKSLRDRAEVHGVEYVLPQRLRCWL